MVGRWGGRLGLKGRRTEGIPSGRRVLGEGWHFILPLGVIIGLLFAGYSPEFCAFWGTVSAAVLSWRHKATRMGPSDVLNGLLGGAQSNTSAGAAIGTIGVIIGGIHLAELGPNCSAVLIDFSNGTLFITPCLVALFSILIGMGPTTHWSSIIPPRVAPPA